VSPRHPPSIDFVTQPINQSLLGFEAQTKKPSWWFWGPNHQTVAADFEAQTGKPKSTSFEAKPEKTITTDFKAKPEKIVTVVLRPNHWQTIATGFEAKPEKTVSVVLRPNHWQTVDLDFEAQPKPALHVSTCTVQTAHGVTRPLDRPATEYPTCVTIPDPLHQVSYSFHDPRHCTSCRTCHLHTMRQANAILQMKQRIRVKLPKYPGFEFKPWQVNDSS
jgi:hypothetical protein